MKRLEIIRRVRSLTRDFSNSIFREQDIIDFLNEGINRAKQIIPELKKEERLLTNQQELLYIPEEYRHLIAVYATARCFGQDEGHYQATTFMNEFEIKMDELRDKILNGDIIIVDPDTGEEITDGGTGGIDYVNLKPYWGINSRIDGDE